MKTFFHNSAGKVYPSQFFPSVYSFINPRPPRAGLAKSSNRKFTISKSFVYKMDATLQYLVKGNCTYSSLNLTLLLMVPPL